MVHHGNKNNNEIKILIDSGKVSYGDTVYSTDWKETLKYNGIVFESICSCNYIGTKPYCEPMPPCEAVKQVVGSFTALSL